MDLFLFILYKNKTYPLKDEMIRVKLLVSLQQVLYNFGKEL